MVNRRLGTSLISVAAIVSLLTVPVSACTCLHQHDETEIGHRCHDSEQEHHHIGTAERDEPLIETTGDLFDTNDTCRCEITGTGLIVRSERIKLDQDPSVGASLSFSTIVTLADEPAPVPIHFAKPKYLTDSFYDLAPKRGPPLI